ncbi:transcription elongation factor GreB [Citrobacter freundii]|nr:transcription elongation factor GreB [Citrobacter freundii]
MKTPLITREGYEKLKQELNYLWREERPEVTKKVTWAASLGDRSENADYQYNKKRLREIDRRVRYLTKCMGEFENRRLLPAARGQKSSLAHGSRLKMTMATSVNSVLSATMRSSVVKITFLSTRRWRGRC